jgi:hypothetical protein
MSSEPSYMCATVREHCEREGAIDLQPLLCEKQNTGRGPARRVTP